MAISQSRQLTEQFYEWEHHTRGHTAVSYPAQLEPPFVPFFGHFVQGEYVDDGRRHTVLSRLKGLFVPDHAVAIDDRPIERPTAFPDDEEHPSLTIYTVTLPKGYAAKADNISHCLVMLAACTTPISFELVATSDTVLLQFVCRDAVAVYVYTQLSAYFFDCTIQETHGDEVLDCARFAEAVYMLDFGLREESMRPIATYTGGGSDPYSPLFGVIQHLAVDEALIVQTLFTGTQNPWANSLVTAATDERGGSFFLDAPEMPGLVREKVSRPLFGATIRIAAFAEYREDAVRLLHHSALALVHASTSLFNALIALDTPDYTINQRLHDLVFRQSHRVGMLLNAAELATLVHLPDVKLSNKLLNSNRTTKPAPVYLHNGVYVLGMNEHQGMTVRVGLSTEQRLKHLHIIGATGSGKSTLLHSLIMQDIATHTGCCVLDPHGDLIDSILKSIPEERINDVVLIDPSDSEFPVGFNILSAHSDIERELLASDLVALFKRFSTSWGDQLHSVLANAIMAFLYNSKPGHLGDLRKFLIEASFRNTVLSTCTDDELGYYWHKEYPLLKSSSIGSILTRLDSFLRPRVIRSMVCQTQSLDFGALMNTNKIVLVKLSQGLIGEENSYLLGACIVAKLQQSAMARQQQMAASRIPFFCYMDEFHHFVTPSMATILSGARKYGLGLICVHQDMRQLERTDNDIASSLMSNVATRICFRLSDTDAKRMQEGFSAFSASDLQTLSVGEAIARVNTADADFNLTVVPDDTDYEDHSHAIIAASRNTYGVPIHPPAHTPSPISPSEPPTATEPPPTPPPIHSPRPKAAKHEPEADTVTEHRYIQTFVKTLAEQYGYKANLEVVTPDGKGKVDVLLEKEGKQIAVEISVSTPADWELHNIQKCIAAGYDSIVVCSSNAKKLQQIREKAATTLSPVEYSRVQFLVTDQLPTLFVESDKPNDTATTTKTMKGYRVKVQYDSTKTQADTESIINRIVRSSGK
jgi:hypothetical protein